MLQTLQQIRVTLSGFKAELTAVTLYDCQYIKSQQLETRPYTWTDWNVGTKFLPDQINGQTAKILVLWSQVTNFHVHLM
jgi:hypothetical protein